MLASVPASNMSVVVIETNVFVAALRSSGGASRQVLRLVLHGRATPIFGNALWNEYQEVLERDLWTPTTSPTERLQVLAALAQAGRWLSVYFAWRPNLPDESDNHLIELAIAGHAHFIVTHNVRDLVRGELAWPHLRVITPALFLEEFQ